MQAADQIRGLPRASALTGEPAVCDLASLSTEGVVGLTLFTCRVSAARLRDEDHEHITTAERSLHAFSHIPARGGHFIKFFSALACVPRRERDAGSLQQRCCRSTGTRDFRNVWVQRDANHMLCLLTLVNPLGGQSGYENVFKCGVCSPPLRACLKIISGPLNSSSKDMVKSANAHPHT